MTKFLTIILTLSFQVILGQEIDYSGKYEFGNHVDSGRIGIIYVHQNSDSTNLFYLELNRGAPSYNSGALVGQMNIYSPGEADFTLKSEDGYFNCSLNFWFSNDSLYIRTNDNAYNCGYGYAVHSDGDYVKTEKERPEFFYHLNGEKISFDGLDLKREW